MIEKLFAVLLSEGIRPELRGPFKDESQRLRACKKFRNADEDNIAFWLNIGKDGAPRIGSFSAGSMMEEEE